MSRTATPHERMLALACMILASFLSTSAHANWTALPGAVQVGFVSAYESVSTLPDGQGGMFVAWEDSTLDSHHESPRVTHLNSQGAPLWPVYQLADDAERYDTSPDLCSDGAGGIYVCWIRSENNVFGFMGYHIRLVHMDAGGNQIFSPMSVNDDGFVQSPSVAPDGSGGVIVTWTSYNNTSCNQQSNQFWASRVDANGNKLWGGNGRAVSPIDMVLQRSADLAKFRAIPSGAAIYCLWSAMDNNCQSSLVKIQRLDVNTGSPTFDPAGLVVYSRSGSSNLDGYGAASNGGACLVVVNDVNDKLVAKRVNSGGSIGWIRVLDGSFPEGPTAVASDGQDGAVLAWYDAVDGLVAQDVGPGGQLLLPQVSVNDLGSHCGGPAFAPPGYPPVAVPDGKDGVLVASPCDRQGSSFRESYCQGISTTGRPAFPANGLQVSPSGLAGNFVSGVPGFLNNALFAWGNANGVWAQQVSLSNLDALTAPAGWDAPLEPRLFPDATTGSVTNTLLIEGNQTWLNWAVLQRGPNPTAAFQERVCIDAPWQTLGGLNVGEGAQPNTYYPVLNFGPFNIPGGPHTLMLYADEDIGPDFSIDEVTEADDVYSHQWIWFPKNLLPGPDTDAPINGSAGKSLPPNGTGHKIRLTGAAGGTQNAWVASDAARRGPVTDPSGGVLSYGDSYGLLLYDLPVGADLFSHELAESHQPYNGTNFAVSIMSADPDSVYPLLVRDSTADTSPDSCDFDFELAGSRIGDGANALWANEGMTSGNLANVYVLNVALGQPMYLALRRHGAPAGTGPLALEAFASTSGTGTGGTPVYVRGQGMASSQVSSEVQTLTIPPGEGGTVLVVVYRTDGSTAGAGFSYDLQVSNVQILGADASPRPHELSFAGARPNPMATAAELAYVLPLPGEASLRIFDVNGRLVRELANGFATAGDHRDRWDGTTSDGTRVAVGLYFAQLRYRDKTLVRRITVLR